MSIQHSSPVSPNKHVRLSPDELFIGPLPHPDLLVKYEQALPGGAERIFAIVEEENAHRKDMEKSLLIANIAIEHRILNIMILGQIMSFILGLIALLCGCALIYFGKNISGTIFSGSGLALLMGVFIYNHKTSKK